MTLSFHTPNWLPVYLIAGPTSQNKSWCLTVHWHQWWKYGWYVHAGGKVIVYKRADASWFVFGIKRISKRFRRPLLPKLFRVK